MKHTEVAERLIGLWRTDPDDEESLNAYGDVALEFDFAGDLIYTIHLPDRRQVVRLTFKIDGKYLVTNQPSAPREERSEFYFTPDGRLAIRANSSAPPTFYVRADSV